MFFLRQYVFQSGNKYYLQKTHVKAPCFLDLGGGNKYSCIVEIWLSLLRECENRSAVQPKQYIPIFDPAPSEGAGTAGVASI